MPRSVAAADTKVTVKPFDARYGAPSRRSEIAVTVTVATLLLTLPSFTANDATYVPATSAINLGVADVASVSEAALPAGLDVSSHW